MRETGSVGAVSGYMQDSCRSISDKGEKYFSPPLSPKPSTGAHETT